VPAWKDYQEEVAAFFRQLGLNAETDVRLRGVRGHHDIDVVVQATFTGFALLWIVECKQWKTPVPQEKVLVLRTIVDDLGADRGILMAENGYQSGALEVATNTNILLTSIADLRETCGHAMAMVKLQSIPPRVDSARDRYWDLDKSDRIRFGLRREVMEYGFNGDSVLKAVDYTVRTAQLRGFPVFYDRVLSTLLAHNGGSPPPEFFDQAEAVISNPSDLFDLLDSELREVEVRLDNAEMHVRQNDLSGTSPQQNAGGDAS
jgi:hypothetical protein